MSVVHLFDSYPAYYTFPVCLSVYLPSMPKDWSSVWLLVYLLSTCLSLWLHFIYVSVCLYVCRESYVVGLSVICMSVSISVYSWLTVRLPVYQLSICPSSTITLLSVCVSVFVCMFICLSVHLSVHLSLCASACAFFCVCMCICLCLYLCFCLFVCLFSVCLLRSSTQFVNYAINLPKETWCDTPLDFRKNGIEYIWVHKIATPVENINMKPACGKISWHLLKIHLKMCYSKCKVEMQVS